VDTNVLVSSTLTPNGNPYKIMSLISDRKIKLFYSLAIMGEYKRVLAYERLNISRQTQRNTINAIEKLGTLIDPPQSTIPLPDETDRTFYDTAKASGAVLITGNLKHYPEEGFVMTPSGFLDGE
jgi:putative PIN family toxin of toxin-antitoxin system